MGILHDDRLVPAQGVRDGVLLRVHHGLGRLRRLHLDFIFETV